MALFNAMGWLIIDYSAPHARGTFFIFTVLILVGYLVLWAYWSGRNWARMLVLITSVVTIFNLRGWNSHSATLLKIPNRVMLAAAFVLGIFLLVWAQYTPSARAFFKGKPAA
jgi:ABC-type proline/glycine betaine transport system permease subunit